MRRIVVVGSPGSGKTTLALKLGDKLGLPVIHLDVLYLRPGWQPSAREDFRARVSRAVAGNEWIVDGSFGGLALDLTIARADTFIAIERPRWLCLWRVMWRSAFQRHGPRPDLPDGCPEMFDLDLLRQTWRWPADRAPEIEAERRQYGPAVPVIRLRTDREIATLLASARRPS
jgi:adenylate kinase family enzyme